AAIRATARGAALVVIVPSKAIVRAVEALGLAIEKTFQALGAAIVAVPKAAFRGLVFAVTAVGKGFKKTFQTAGAAVAADAKATFNDLVRAIIAVGKAFRAVAVALIAGSKVISRWAQIAAAVLAKETVRGAAITIIPAIVTAALVWFFAIRIPP